MNSIPDIFGADIAGQINQHLGPLLFPLVLYKTAVTRDPADPTKPVNSEVAHPGTGFVDQKSVRNASGTLVQTNVKSIAVLGASLPAGVFPEPGDVIFIENARNTIADNGVSRDPAGALFECAVE